MLGVLYFAWGYIKAQYRAWQVKQAADATAQGEQNFVQTEVGQNQTNTNADNNGRTQLDNMP